MISGISSSGGYFPSSHVSRARTAATPQSTAAPEPQVDSQPPPQELSAPEGDEQSLSREFNLFDLATRQFGQILPRLELATVPLE